MIASIMRRLDRFVGVLRCTVFVMYLSFGIRWRGESISEPALCSVTERKMKAVGNRLLRRQHHGIHSN